MQPTTMNDNTALTTAPPNAMPLRPIPPVVKTLATKPKVSVITEDHDVHRYYFANVPLAYVNALRRTVLTDIPIVVFRTFPYEKNDAVFIENTTRRNNEILKQRLSCIPIYGLSADNDEYKDLLLEVHETNTGPDAKPVTTEHFKVKRISSNAYLPRSEVKKMFPPWISASGEEYYIHLTSLSPRLYQDAAASSADKGSTLHFTCKFSVGTAKENGSFNVSSICALEHMVDKAKQKEVLEQTMVPKWTAEKKDVEFETANWLLLDGKRIVVPNHYYLILKSVGPIETEDLFRLAVKYTIRTLAEWSDLLANGQMPIKTTESTMEKGFDIALPNETHTNGNLLKTVMYDRFARGSSPRLCYIGIIKEHPFNAHSLFRAAFDPKVDDATPQALAQMMADAIGEIVATLQAFVVS